MGGRRLAAFGTFLLLVAVGSAEVSAGDVVLSFGRGRVTLQATEASVGQILSEWERLGGTRIDNRELLPGTPVTLSINNEPEAQALAVVLRAIAGYLAVRRPAGTAGASVFEKIVVLRANSPGDLALAAPPGTGQTPATDGRRRVERRLLADGRYVTLVENPDRPGELTAIDDDLVGQPSQAGGPGRTPGTDVGPASSGQTAPPRGQQSIDPFNLQPPPGFQSGSAPSAAPGVPPGAVTPGVLVPGQKAPPTPQAPPKEPGGDATPPRH